MTAEIGINADGEPYVSLSHMTQTEYAVVEFFRERLGIVCGPDGYYRIPSRSGDQKQATP